MITGKDQWHPICQESVPGLLHPAGATVLGSIVSAVQTGDGKLFNILVTHETVLAGYIRNSQWGKYKRLIHDIDSTWLHCCTFIILCSK